MFFLDGVMFHSEKFDNKRLLANTRAIFTKSSYIFKSMLAMNIRPARTGPLLLVQWVSMPEYTVTCISFRYRFFPLCKFILNFLLSFISLKCGICQVIR